MDHQQRLIDTYSQNIGPQIKIPKQFIDKIDDNVQQMRIEFLISDGSSYQFYLLSMPQQINANKSSSQKSTRYDDWMCLLCQNHNYSFRLICNRCHVQTKEQNAYMNHIYQQHLELAQEHQQQLAQHPHHPYFALDSFPNVLLLMINDDPWEEYPQRREPSEILNVKWINNLIEE